MLAGNHLRRNLNGWNLGRFYEWVLAKAPDAKATWEADLASYLLFDGSWADTLSSWVVLMRGPSETKFATSFDGESALARCSLNDPCFATKCESALAGLLDGGASRFGGAPLQSDLSVRAACAEGVTFSFECFAQQGSRPGL